MSYVIIGNSAAGIAAAESIRKFDQKGKVTIISDEPHNTYGRPLISYFLKGTSTAGTMHFRKPPFYTDNGIDTIFGHAAVKIADKHVVLDNGDKVSYDKLLLATGSVPFVPTISGIEGKDNVFTFLKYDDAIALKAVVKKDSRVVIVGGGLIGLKAAEGLHTLCDDITVVEFADRVLAAVIDKQGGTIVSDHLENNGIKCILNNTVDTLRDGEVLLKSGDVLPCDFLIVAVGVRPAITLAKNFGLTVNRGIVTNTHMQTSVPDIYAAGDCVESYDILDGTQKILALWPNAVRQGRIAGASMAGHADELFDGGMPLNSVGFFGLKVMTCGIINPADESGYEIVRIAKGQQYKKFVMQNNMLKGFILINAPNRAGLYTTLIRDGVDLATIDGDITNGIGLINFKPEERAKKIGGGAGR